MGKVTKCPKIEVADSKVHMLDEMLDEMQKSIENAKTVKSQQEILVEIVEAAEDAEKFTDFVDGMKKQIENISKQIEQLQIKIEYTKAIISRCKKDEMKALTDLIFKVFGIFEQ